MLYGITKLLYEEDNVMENLKVKLYNAILTIFDTSYIEYEGLDDEEFIQKICESVGMTEPEYRDLMLEKDLGIEHDFEEFCPICEHINEYKLSDTKDYKNGKRIAVCQNCGSVIFACNLCDMDNCDCGKCYIEEGYKF